MSSKPSIPSWQRAATSTPPTPTPTPSSTTLTPETTSEEPSKTPPELPAEDATKDAPEDAPSEQSSDSSSLLDQASRFLRDPAIRDAPQEKKVAFLESKGVRPEEIEELLEKQMQPDATPDITEAGERAWSTAPPKPSKPPAPPTQPREIPPIVTYPEFLAQPTQDPPLINTRRLLNTAYITGGIMATMYGLSKYIIAPMSQNLAEARHDFASHTQEKLEELNMRLKEAASVDPATTGKARPADAGDDVSEADSDPTELYHRDYGTQTSPSLSRRPSLSSGAEDHSAITGHENRLKILTSHLRELESTHSNDKASFSSLKTKLSDLTTYLGEMSYQTQHYHSMGGLYGGTYGLPKMKDGKDDQIEVLKSDIRAVKGVFLSARNFPAGGRSSMPIGRTST